jgi:mRNA interferase RelE/StbE
MYRFIIKKPAKKFIDGLPINERRRIVNAIERLPDSGDIKPLQGKKNQGVLRLRVGKYRVIYTVDEGQFIVFIIDAGNRGQIYSRY